jgi:hypothetical protein
MGFVRYLPVIYKAPVNTKAQILRMSNEAQYATPENPCSLKKPTQNNRITVKNVLKTMPVQGSLDSYNTWLGAQRLENAACSKTRPRRWGPKSDTAKNTLVTMCMIKEKESPVEAPRKRRPGPKNQRPTMPKKACAHHPQSSLQLNICHLPRTRRAFRTSEADYKH